ncbi:equilibrative nucleobase transporter 1-like isoform X2 [Conger conger]|uniref:equilibrative nucleobase transporter 1-like isoform X2 n=1 Tax=Conger conger TaxID=82655 RepID=UPI002A5A4A8C|nr:equilibrative nucleobase transporter 1-like isoform X2 [Conger conger]
MSISAGADWPIREDAPPSHLPTMRPLLWRQCRPTPGCPRLPYKGHLGTPKNDTQKAITENCIHMMLRGVSLRFWLTLATGLVECLCFTGVVYGWPSLVFILKASGYFRDQCVNATGPNDTQYMDCSKQDELFSLVFTIAAFLQNFLSLLNGFFFDRFGTMTSRLLAIILYTTGTLLIAFSHPEISNILFPGLAFIAVGSDMLLLTNMQVGNLFDTHRSTVITLYIGAYSSSAIIFLIIKVASERGISLHHAFFFLSACSIIHLMRTFILMPKRHIPYPVPEGYTYGRSCGQSKCNTHCFTEKAQTDNTEPVQGEEGIENATSEQGNPQQTPQTDSFKQCVLSWLFLWHLVWLSVTALRHILFISTLNPMLTLLAHGDTAQVSHYTNVFAYTQLFGILCAPLNGLIIDRYKAKQRAEGETEEESNLHSVVLSLFLTALQCLLFSICATIPVLPLQYLTFVLQVLNRAFSIGGKAAFISIAFPVCHFGKLIGVANATVTVVLLLQFPYIILVNEVLDGDPLYVSTAPL